jgi:ubiquinone/menaquinone biosynthesis C-methylase UbiE
MFGPWAPELVRRARPLPGERVLDVACGTGAVTRLLPALVGAGGRVVGLDINAAMLKIASGLGLAVEWVRASALEMPFANAAFDVVLCQQGVQFFPDRASALREMRRVLAPAGRLAIATWSTIARNPAFHVLNEAGLRHIGVPIMAQPYSLPDADTVRALLADAGYRDITIDAVEKRIRFTSAAAFVQSMLPAAATTVTVLQEMDEDERAALVVAVERDVVAALHRFEGADGLVFPTRSHLASAST